MSITRLVHSSMNPVLPVSSPGMVSPRVAARCSSHLLGAVIHEPRVLSITEIPG